MRKPSPNTWPDWRTEELKKCANAGMSASQIAAQVGMTRNAVIGKASRLGIQIGSSIRPKQAVPRKRKRKQAAPKTAQATSRQRKIAFKAQVAAAPMIPKEKAFSMPPEGAVTLMELGDNCCRWPVGELFCGGAIIARGKPYCAKHTRLGLWSFAAPNRAAEQKTW